MTTINCSTYYSLDLFKLTKKNDGETQYSLKLI